MAKFYCGELLWAATVGTIALFSLAQASAQATTPPAIMTMSNASPWVDAPTTAELKAVEPPGDEPAALRIECRADDGGHLIGCGFSAIHGGDVAVQAARTLLPKYRLADQDIKRLSAEKAYVVFYIVWRNPNNCRPPTCAGVVPPAPTTTPEK